MSPERDRQLLDATQEALAAQDDEPRTKKPEEEQIADELRSQDDQDARTTSDGQATKADDE